MDRQRPRWKCPICGWFLEGEHSTPVGHDQKCSAKPLRIENGVSVAQWEGWSLKNGQKTKEKENGHSAAASADIF